MLLPGRAAAVAPLFLVAAAGSASAAPQVDQAVAARTVSLAPDRSAVRHVASDGALWARGASYKASAGAEGFTYVPFLGSDAPRSWPVRFRLRSATIGGRPLALSAPDVRRDGDRLVLDRGSVEVRYDLDVDSVEQSFALEGIAGERDELLLFVDVTTDLRTRAEGRSFRFEGPRGGVGFGAAVALDGAGRSLEIETTVHDGGLVFRVPADFVASSIGPVVVDPVISTFAIDTFAVELTAPDVAFQSVSGVYLVAYEENFSAVDGDVYWRALDAASLAILDEGYLDLAGTRAARPRVASLTQDDSFLCVFSRENVGGQPELIGVYRDAAAVSPWNPEFTVATPDLVSIPAFHDVGGERFTGAGPANYAVVWERRPSVAPLDGSSIVARLIAADGVPAPTSIEITPFQSGQNTREPSISKFSGDPSVHGAWWIAYSNGATGSPSNEVRGARLAFDGTITDADNRLWSLPFATDVRDVTVSAPYTGAYTESFHVAFDWNSGSGRQTFTFARAPGSTFGRVLELGLADVSLAEGKLRPSFGTLGDRAALVYYQRTGPGIPPDLFVSSFNHVLGNEIGVGERRTQIGQLQAVDPGAAAVASRESGGDVGSSVLFVAWEDEAFVGGGRSIYGALVDFPDPPAVVGNFCRGFFNSTGDLGYLTGFGDNSTTAPKTLRATRLPPNALGYFLAATSIGSGFPPGSSGRICVGGSIGRYVTSILDSGPAGQFDFVIDPTSIPQPTGSVSAMAGDRWYFQAWHRDSVAGASTSNFTNAVILQF